MITVQLPRQFEADRLFLFIKENFGTFESVPDAVEFDFSRMNFAFPSGVVFLSNLTRFLLRQGCEVSYSGMDTNKECIKFLDDSLFFQQHLREKLSQHSAPRVTTQPLIELRHKDCHAWIHNIFAPWLSEISGVPMSGLAEFQTCMSELFNNINDHSAFDVGSVFAQWYPQKKNLQIVIADFGQGIPETVRRIEPHLSDSEAIIRSFDEGFSSRSTPQNRGQGLYYLRQNVLEHLGGALTVRSREGAVTFRKSGNSLTVVPYVVQGFCPGTMIEFNIQTDVIEFEEENGGDFEWW
ncbi:ATP-binding protein [Loktanella agnita]|uniref:ATP-binding protein n=1 Tax=Loktanella agnita TaxID=287097 RepID=UPI003988138B